jgi:hypothetical protein
LLPKIARAVTRSTPRLTKSIGAVARTLHRNPQTRHLLKVVPAIARRTVGSVARQAAHGRRITPGVAVRTLARQARRVLTHPGQRRHALRHHRRLEHKFHRRYGRGMGYPHWRWGRGRRWHGRYPYRYGRYRGVRGTAPGVQATAPGAPGVVYPGGRVAAPGVAPVRYGRVVGGQCTCPACGTASYCRCCGQVLR